MRGSTNKFWECWSRQPMWNEMGITYLPSPPPKKLGIISPLCPKAVLFIIIIFLKYDYFLFFSLSSSLGSVFFTGFLFSFLFFHWIWVSRYWEKKKRKRKRKRKKSCIMTGVGPPNSVKNSEWWKLSDGTKQP